MLPDYAELHCVSNYSFNRGASFPEELVARAVELGYAALAITDECSVSGAVRAHIAAKDAGLKLMVGSEFVLDDGLHLVLLAMNRHGYGCLSQLITRARRQATKGEYDLTRTDIENSFPVDCLALWLPRYQAQPDHDELRWLSGLFRGSLWIAVELGLHGDERGRTRHAEELAQKYNIPVCATGNVHMHRRNRRRVQDTLTAIRQRRTLARAGFELSPNAERYMRSRAWIEKLFPAEWIAASLHISRRCQFSLDELHYEYPRELVPAEHTPASWLRKLTQEGMQCRWPQGVPDKTRQQIEQELKLIAELDYEPYFLTVHDIVRYARQQGILCQGRGSAANSAICYCLGITEVDPSRMNLLFERFVSRERDEPPDIDVDFEHERREEVIQYIYRRYGRSRAALAATVITWQPRSAIREVGKALGFSLDQTDRLAKSWYWWDGKQLQFDVEQVGMVTRDNRMLECLVELASAIIGFPRYLSQHVGGFVIAADDLTRLVPVENAAMADRTVIQWEKDDLEALGLLKIDVLGLGMLSAIRKTLALISTYSRDYSVHRPMTLADIPAEDPVVYRSLQQADTIGVFQIESRAQMSMLPRLKPKNFYDLVIEIAIVRPGPIQGDMVHPYLMRRNGQQQVSYPSDAVRKVLERTLGVPIFQEQVMQLAMVAAGFSAGEADRLRRSMAAWKRRGGLEQFEQRLVDGMLARGYTAEFAQQIYRQILGFGEYGFPESHSASFALLAYASAWLKVYHPAAFTCALLNSQPMGFYAPAQLIQDAQRHGVQVRPVDVNHSYYDCTLEFDQAGLQTTGETMSGKTNLDNQVQKHLQRQVELPPGRQPVLRLGMRLVKGLSRTGVDAIVKQREQNNRAAVCTDVQELARRAGLSRTDLEALAAADALLPLAGDRHRAFWHVSGIEPQTALLAGSEPAEADVLLSVPGEGLNILHDYATTGLTLRRHPLALLRARLEREGVWTAEQLLAAANDEPVLTAGIVINRQRPSTASGVIFVTLEDESGYINLIVWPQLAERQRKVLLKAKLLMVHGKVQAQDGVVYVVASRLQDRSQWLGSLETQSRDFR